MLLTQLAKYSAPCQAMNRVLGSFKHPKDARLEPAVGENSVPRADAESEQQQATSCHS